MGESKERKGTVKNLLGNVKDKLRVCRFAHHLRTRGVRVRTLEGLQRQQLRGNLFKSGMPTSDNIEVIEVTFENPEN
ncbi:hypothetical protein A2188_01705 [Candidatus Woesebacteria bacterium RIFOXYA1_FULL_43_9]|uniref:Uncharacterized protein n=1 Tax=Candidatus Woesebacteria bacterium RIFOXYA1_FULL_43_9 TaxID=1802534 RepID=A0A1F8CPY6_9BACT|nr:MAG: hypothetical protein A2188_01705 [Candidatus Woesebacteria bacterium RIFOXYA1_FULL_43_9]